MAGKGDKPRPINNRDEYNESWDRIFGKKKKKVEKPSDEQEKDNV